MLVIFGDMRLQKSVLVMLAQKNLIFIWLGKLSAMFSLYFKDLSYNHAFKFK